MDLLVRAASRRFARLACGRLVLSLKGMMMDAASLRLGGARFAWEGARFAWEGARFARLTAQGGKRVSEPVSLCTPPPNS